MCRHAHVPGSGPPAYNAKPLADGTIADGVGPVHRGDGPLAIADGQPGWRAPVPVRRDLNGPIGQQPGFDGPVAHRQMSASNGLMAHRGFVF